MHSQLKGVTLNLEMNSGQAACALRHPRGTSPLTLQALLQTRGQQAGHFSPLLPPERFTMMVSQNEGKTWLRVFPREGTNEANHSGAFSRLSEGWPKGQETKIVPPGFRRRVPLKSSGVLISPKRNSRQIVGNETQIDSGVREILTNALLLSQHIDSSFYRSWLN